MSDCLSMNEYGVWVKKTDTPTLPTMCTILAYGHIITINGGGIFISGSPSEFVFPTDYPKEKPKDTTNEPEITCRVLRHWNLTVREMRMVELFCSEDFVTTERLCKAVTFDNYSRPDQYRLANLLHHLRKKTAPYGMKIITKSKRGYYLENRETWYEQLIITDKVPPNVWGHK